MLEICIQTSYDQNVQLILKSYLPVVYGTPLMIKIKDNGNPIDTSIDFFANFIAGYIQYWCIDGKYRI
jgi:hypothetical protein